MGATMVTMTANRLNMAIGHPARINFRTVEGSMPQRRARRELLLSSICGGIWTLCLPWRRRLLTGGSFSSTRSGISESFLSSAGISMSSGISVSVEAVDSLSQKISGARHTDAKSPRVAGGHRMTECCPKGQRGNRDPQLDSPESCSTNHRGYGIVVSELNAVVVISHLCNECVSNEKKRPSA